MPKEEWRTQIHSGWKVLVKTLLVIVLTPFVLGAIGMLWEKWSQPPQSWFWTQRRMYDLSRSIKGFTSFRGYLPVPAPQREDTAERSRGLFMIQLTGDPSLPPSRLNRPFILIEPPHKDAFIKDKDGWAFVDFWGEPYFLLFDTNNDKEIANPEFEAAKSRPDRARKNAAGAPAPSLKMPLLIYSSGPDRDPNTWDDNILKGEEYRWMSRMSRGW